MPRRRPDKKPSVLGRTIGGIAGIALGTSAVLGLVRSFGNAGRGGSPFMSLALLIPTVILLRYALTGKIVQP